jgi:thiol-disulfide isomerase/thioredoxin
MTESTFRFSNRLQFRAEQAINSSTAASRQRILKTSKMKKLIILFLLFSFKNSFSQEGKIYHKNSVKKNGVENVYVYEPPKGLLIPDNAVVKYFYDFSNHQTIPLVKKENHYEFSLKIPDSLTFIMFTIVDSKNKSIDNNNDKGFVVYLKNNTKGQLESAKLDKLGLSDYANYILGLNITPDEIITEIEKVYKEVPYLKKEENIYVYYLELKYKKNRNAVRLELINYAQFLEKKNNEKSLSLAKRLYSILKMKNKVDQITSIVLEKYPKGELAKNNFINEMFSNKNTNEQYILERLSAYEKKFNDTSDLIKNRFYQILINYFLKIKDLANINKYQNLMTDKINLASMYNNFAWNLCGENLSSPGIDLDFAKQISKKSIDIVKDRMNHPIGNENHLDFQLSYIGYADTYALILFKQQKYDSAFMYQDDIYKLDTIGMGIDGRERYAVYMEKAKGLEQTKSFIEQQLSEGQNSALMISQLHEIYKNLNIPDSEFEKIVQSSSTLRNKKLKEEAIAKFGDITAINFNLTNLTGKNIKLSDYKGKVVVLDFWATWCGPCRASFPHMQELVNEYKNKDVEFFFIDTWQQGKPSVIKKEVSKFITDNKYTFNVLFDYNNHIVAKYKIVGIPTKIAIDKNGEFLSINSSADNLEALIDNSIN